MHPVPFKEVGTSDPVTFTAKQVKSAMEDGANPAREFFRTAFLGAPPISIRIICRGVAGLRVQEVPMKKTTLSEAAKNPVGIDLVLRIIESKCSLVAISSQASQRTLDEGD